MCLIHEAKLAISSELVLFHLTQQVLNVIILIIICNIHKLPSSKHAQNDTPSLIYSMTEYHFQMSNHYFLI